MDGGRRYNREYLPSENWRPITHLNSAMEKEREGCGGVGGEGQSKTKGRKKDGADAATRQEERRTAAQTGVYLYMTHAQLTIRFCRVLT